LSDIFVKDGKNKKREKTEKKTSVKHIRIRLIGGCVNNPQDKSQEIHGFIALTKYRVQILQRRRSDMFLL